MKDKEIAAVMPITEQALADLPLLQEFIDAYLAQGMIDLHPLRDVYTPEQVETFITTEKARYAEHTGSELLWRVHARMNAEYSDYTLLYGGSNHVPPFGRSPIEGIQLEKRLEP